MGLSKICQIVQWYYLEIAMAPWIGATICPAPQYALIREPVLQPSVRAVTILQNNTVVLSTSTRSPGFAWNCLKSF